MAIKSDWIVASTTARNSLTVSDGDVAVGAEAKVLADGRVYRAIRSGSGANCWDDVAGSSPFPMGFPSYGTLSSMSWDVLWGRSTATQPFDTAGSGGSSTTYNAPSGARTGGIELTTQSSSTASYVWRTSNGWLALGTNQVRVRNNVYIPTLSTGSEEFTASSGIGDSDTATETDGCIFVHDRSVSATNWICRTTSNSTTTETDSGVAISTSAVQALEVEVNYAGTSVRFWIDGVLAATHTTNIPTGTSRLVGVIAAKIVKSVGTTARTIRVSRSMGEIAFAAPQ